MGRQNTMPQRPAMRPSKHHSCRQRTRSRLLWCHRYQPREHLCGLLQRQHLIPGLRLSSSRQIHSRQPTMLQRLPQQRHSIPGLRPSSSTGIHSRRPTTRQHTLSFKRTAIARFNHPHPRHQLIQPKRLGKSTTVSCGAGFCAPPPCDMRILSFRGTQLLQLRSRRPLSSLQHHLPPQPL